MKATLWLVFACVLFWSTSAFAGSWVLATGTAEGLTVGIGVLVVVVLTALSVLGAAIRITFKLTQVFTCITQQLAEHKAQIADVQRQLTEHLKP